LQRHPEIPKKDFASLMGVISLACMVPVFLIQSEPRSLFSEPQFPLYLLCSLGLGIGSSWLANWLWNICSFHVPSEISGTLLVFETLFGLIYSFGFEHRFPAHFEVLSILLCVGGVVLAVTGQVRASKPSLAA
jgi:drug/metabolite transporter (DMT)-like permease